MDGGCLLDIPNLNTTGGSGSPERHSSYLGSTMLELSSKDAKPKYSAVNCILKSRYKICNYNGRLEDSTPSKQTIRPSTAVMKHVKKISEDFTLTQTKFEKSLEKRTAVLIQIEKPKLLSPRIPTGLTTPANCSKCVTFSKEPKKKLTLPYIAPVKSNKSKNSKLESLSKSTKIQDLTRLKPLSRNVLDDKEMSNGVESPLRYSPTRTKNNCLISIDDLAHSQTETKSRVHSNERSPKRRPCLSASSSPRLQRITLDQLKRARIYTERAIKEGRVFSIYGYFPGIRYALKRRGWVEKVLHNAPYVNPHPSNCVCFQANCTSGFHTNLNQPKVAMPSKEKSETPSLTKQNQSKMAFNFILKNKEMVKKYNSKKQKVLELNESTDEEVKEEEVGGEENTTERSLRDEEESISRVDSAASGESDEKLYETENQKQLGSDEREVNLEKKPVYEFNPSILCPEEIRNGFQKCITEDKIPLYQYSVPIYEKPSPPSYSIDKCDQEVEENEEEQEQEREENLEDEIVDEQELNTDGETSEAEDVKSFDPYNPYPEFDFDIMDVDTSLVGRLLKNVEPNLIWTWNKDAVSYKHLTKDQIVNRFPQTPFTTKHGLCDTMQQLHWFSEVANVDTFVPRGYCIGHGEERAAFIQDYRITACLSILVQLTEKHAEAGFDGVANTMGEVSLRRIRQAVEQVECFIESCKHDHIDVAPPTPLKDSEWDGIISAHFKFVHKKKKIKSSAAQFEIILEESVKVLKRVEDYWPQLALDGVRNVWIVKPGAQSRGRGIFLLNHLQEILSLVQSPLIYETKYVVQKYIERPFLVCNTKFDIRQWFMVTDWNPLTVWMYRSSYIRFCSQQYDLTNSAEAIHLSNAAIQCKYTNGVRSKILPEENMWDCEQFAEFLRSRGWGEAWDDRIYPAMRDALKAAMLAAQVEMDAYKHGFEFFGADFMLSEDLRVWLIEINSSPCMASTTNVTKRLCSKALEDVIKVIIDGRQSKDADTGDFELIYKDSQKIAHNPPYVGVNLQVIGKQISKSVASNEKVRRPPAKSTRTQSKSAKPLRMYNVPMTDFKKLSV